MVYPNGIAALAGGLKHLRCLQHQLQVKVGMRTATRHQ